MSQTVTASTSQGHTDYDAFCRNAAGQWYNGSAFENYDEANLADYRIAVTETPAGSGLYVAVLPDAATVFELRYRGATLSASYVVAGPAEVTEVPDAVVAAINADATQITQQANAATAATQATAAALDASKIPRLSAAVAAGAVVRRNKVAATSTTLDETLEATP